MSLRSLSKSAISREYSSSSSDDYALLIAFFLFYLTSYLSTCLPFWPGNYFYFDFDFEFE